MPAPRNLGSGSQLLELGKNAVAPNEPGPHVTETRAPLVVVPAQHEGADAPVGKAALLTEDQQRALPLGLLVLGCPLDPLVRVHRLHGRAQAGEVGGRLRIGPDVHVDLDGHDTLRRHEWVDSREVRIRDLGVDAPVTPQLREEHGDATGDDHLAVEDRLDAAGGGNGLGAGVGGEGGDASEKGHVSSGAGGGESTNSENLPYYHSKKMPFCQAKSAFFWLM